MTFLPLFKKYFIPHEENDHKPHILRTEATVFFLSIILIFEIIFYLQIFIIYPRVNYYASILPGVLVSLTNKDRENKNLSNLNANPILEKAAQMKARDMAQKSYFSHNSPEGITPWYWLEEAGYEYDYAGENLAINFFDSSDVNSAWMESPSHRENILNSDFTEIGIAAAKGFYNGKETTFIVQMFGRPANIDKRLMTNDLQQGIDQQLTTNNQQQELSVNNPPNPLLKRGQGNLEGLSVNNQLSPKESKLPTGQANINNGVLSAQIENINQPPLREITSNLQQNELNKAISETKNIVRTILAMPRVMNAYFYTVLLTIISTALALKILIKIKIQHKTLIANGVLLIIFMAAALLVNQKISLLSANIL